MNRLLSEGQVLALPDLETGVLLPTPQLVLKLSPLINIRKTVEIFGTK